MKSDAFRLRILRRISHTRYLKIETLSEMDDAAIIVEFWRHLKLCELENFDEAALAECTHVVERMRNRAKRNARFAQMKVLEANGYFELAKAKERDPRLYEQIVGRDAIGRPETMNFSDVLMRCWMQERDPDTGQRKIDISPEPDKNAENYEEMEEEEDDEKDENSEVTDMINEDLTTEERQAEFIALMRERFVDGKDPDHDYEQDDAYDENADDDMTSEWFDDEEEEIVNRQPSELATNDDEDEDDYMTMDLTQFCKS